MKLQFHLNIATRLLVSATKACHVYIGYEIVRLSLLRVLITFTASSVL